MSAAFEHAGEVRIALAAIVADPEQGPGALSAAPVLSNLLSDYLPDSPRETGPLIAAAQAGAAGILRDHVARGMDAATAIRITASALATRTAYSREACLWVAGELALALGLTTADMLPAFGPGGEETDWADVVELPPRGATGSATAGRAGGGTGPAMRGAMAGPQRRGGRVGAGVEAPRYSTDELRGELARFEQELRAAGLKENSVVTYVDRTGRFLKWLDGDYQPRGPR